MSKMKRFLSLTLVFAMLMTMMVGCGGKNDEIKETPPTVQNLIEKANKTVSEAESIDYALKMDLDMTAGSEDMQMVMEMHLSADLETHIKSKTTHMKANINAMLFGFKIKQEQEMYLVNEDDKQVMYEHSTEDDEKSEWTYSFVEEDDENTINSLAELNDVFAVILEKKDAFTLAAETVIVDNMECYKVSGKIVGASDIFDKMDMDDLVENINPDELETIVNIYFTKSGKNLHKLEIDLAEGLTKMYAKLAEESEDAEMQGEAEIEEFKVSITYKSFNTLEEIKLPNAIKDKAVEKNEIDWEDTEMEEDYIEYVTTICPHCDAFNSLPAEDITDDKITCGICDEEYEYTEE